MKKSEWVYVANAIWGFTEINDGKLSRLLKELVLTVNDNIEVIINDNDENGETIRSDGEYDSNTTSIFSFKGSK